MKRWGGFLVVKICIIHVGNMINKGTQALLESDFYILRDIFKGNVSLSVSTTDIEGVKRLNLNPSAILPPIIDIPYEKADSFARKLGFKRAGTTYKIFALGSLIFMFVQAGVSVFSAILTRMGLKGCYRREVLENIRESHLVISYSDENFKEAASFLRLNVYWILTWWSLLFSRTWDVLIAKSLRKRVIVFPNSIGPFRTWLGRSLAKLALNMCDFILVREPLSYRTVSNLGIRTPKKLTSDSTLLLVGKEQNCFSSFSHPLIGVSPGFYAQSLSKVEIETYISEHARALDEAIEKHGFLVVFLPHYVSGFQNDDLDVSKLALKRMKNKQKAMIVEASSAKEFKSLLGCMDIVVSSKMHPAVLAVSECVPTLCIAYDQKQSGFFQYLGLNDCVVSIQDFSNGGLFSRIDSVWNNKERIREVLQKKVPVLKESIIGAVREALSSYLENV